VGRLWEELLRRAWGVGAIEEEGERKRVSVGGGSGEGGGDVVLKRSARSVMMRQRLVSQFV